MDRRTRNLFALVLVVLIAITGGAALLLSDSSMLDPDGSSATPSVEGVIVGVDSAGAEQARGGARRRRLARAHEADEDERYRGFHPMRRS